jgi:hypothetical protein
MYTSNFALYTLIPFLSLLRPTAADTCSQVNALNTVELKRQLSVEYFQEQQNYWSTGCGALKPSCILFPKTTSEVSFPTVQDTLWKQLRNRTFAFHDGECVLCLCKNMY